MSDGFEHGLDLIRLVGVRARGHHGVFARELEAGQEFVVDVDLGLAWGCEAARTDDLRDTVDYGAVAQAVVDIVSGPPKKLIETVAEEIAEGCLSLEHVRAVRVTVHKPQAPIPVPFDDVAVTITRPR